MRAPELTEYLRGEQTFRRVVDRNFNILFATVNHIEQRLAALEELVNTRTDNRSAMKFIEETRDLAQEL